MNEVRGGQANMNLFMRVIKNKIPETRLTGSGFLTGGGLKFLCGNVAEATKLRVELLKNLNEDTVENFDINVPGKKSPQVIIYGIDSSIDEETLKKGLLDKNESLSSEGPEGKPISHFKIDFKIPARDTKLCHWVMSVNPQRFHAIINGGGLFSQWARHRTVEFVGVRQCRVCFLIGHTSRTCPNADPPKCPKCGENKKDGHKCTKLKCVNCVDHNSRSRNQFPIGHDSLDRKCKSYQRHRDIVISRTNYGI